MIEVFFLVTVSKPDRFLQDRSAPGLLGDFATAYRTTDSELAKLVWEMWQDPCGEKLQCVSIKIAGAEVSK